MNTTEKLSTRQSAKYQTVNGVTYFKLKSEFDGDYTKNCGLLGEEIDQNFYFLRGYDIESVELNDDRQLVITRVDKDYEPIIVDLAEELVRPTFTYDKTTGIITITYPGEEPIEIGGFLVEGQDVRIATNATLKGNGTIYKPLGISPVEKTGTYAPAAEFFDISEDDIMPEGKGAGYRIVTKETMDSFGRLYPYKAVEIISEQLKEGKSAWRVPTKKDWDELLNAFEPYEEYRNHSAVTVDFFGQWAGACIKSYGTLEAGDGLWKECAVDHSVEGEGINLKVLPLGRSAERNFFMNDTDHDAEGFGSIASFWTSSDLPNGNAYAKTFAYNDARVYQELKNKNAKLSIRLCKDYTYDNFNEQETILNVNYPCELIQSPLSGECKVEYNKIWTSINVLFSEPEYGGVRSEEWSAVTDSDCGRKIVYYINEWDGVKWTKKLMQEGDSVVILDYEDAPYHEWRIINGELVDTIEAVKNEFSGEIENVDERITSLESRQDVDEQRLDSLESRQNVDEQRLDKIEPRVDALEERQNVDEERLSDVEARIDNLENRQDIDEIRLNNLEDRQNRDEERLNNLEERQNKDEERFDNLEERQNKDEERLDEVEPRVDNLEERQNVDEERLDKLEERQNVDETRLDNLEGRQNVDETRLDNLEGRQNVDEQRLDALEPRVDNLESGLAAEIENRIANDITPGDYEIKANESVVIPTNGEDVADLSIKIADDFFDFGSF